MEITVTVKVVIKDDNGFDESDIASLFEGEGKFAGAVKNFVSDGTYGDITVDTVEVNGVEY